MPAESDYILQHTTPSPSDYVRLRTIAGLTPPPPSADFTRALANSIHCIVAYHTSNGDVPVGMVRLVGDGVVFCQIIDMAVDPLHQGQGLGTRLMRTMLDWVDANCKDAYVCLIGDPAGQKLYRNMGFTETVGIGMKRSAWGR